MKKIIFLAILVCFCFGFFACGSSGPTTPQLPDKFQITDIKVYMASVFYWGDFTAIASYANNDDQDAIVTGTIDFGDGTVRDLKDNQGYAGPVLPKNSSGSWESTHGMHDYAAKGVYKVKVQLIAQFKQGPISSTFEKDVEIKIK